MPTELLGGAAPQRDLHFIFLADCSGSMTGAKISALNAAIEAAIGPMRQTVANQPNVRVLVRAIRFSDHASWHLAQETPLEQFQWHELPAGGRTSTGAAIRLALEALSKLRGRQYPPVLVLVSDGQATDDAQAAIRELSANTWGQRAVRRAVAIGDDADIESLKAFIGEPEIEPIVAHRPEDIAAALCFVSVGSLSSASIGKEFGGLAPSSPPVPIPGAPTAGSPNSPSGSGTAVDPSMPKNVF